MIGRLLAITPPAAVASELDPGLVDAWLAGGAAELGIAVLLREPGGSVAGVLGAARFCGLRAALAERGLPTLLSVDPAAIDQAAVIRGASPALAGVQLRGDPSPEVIEAWRAALPGLVIGRSCHGVDPPKPGRPAPGPADYTCLAPIFAPNTASPGVEKRALGLAPLRRWAAVVPRVFALGGVTLETAAACLAAGAEGLAGISLFFGQTAAAQQTVAALSRAFDRHHAPQARQRR